MAPKKPRTIEPFQTLVGGASMPTLRYTATTLLAADGRTLYSGHTDGLIWVWDARTGEHRATWSVPDTSACASAMALSADGSKLLVALGHHVHEFSLPRGEVIARHGPLSGGALSLALSPRDDLLIVGTGDGRAVVLGPDGSARASVAHGSAVLRVAVAPSGEEFATVGGADRFDARRWRLDGTPIAALRPGREGSAQLVAYLPDGDLVVACNSASGSSLTRWNSQSNAPRWERPCTDNTIALATLDDGERLITSHQDRALCVWDAATGTRLSSFDCQQIGDLRNPATSVVSARDGTLYVALAYLRIARLSRVGAVLSPADLPPLQPHMGSLRALAFAGAKAVVSLGSQGDLARWDLTWVDPTVRARPAEGAAIALSGAASAVLVKSPEEVLSANGRTLKTKRVSPSSWVDPDECPSLSENGGATLRLPDGTRALVARRGAVALLRCPTGEELATLNGLPGVATALAISPNGRLAAASDGTRIVVWQLPKA